MIEGKKNDIKKTIRKIARQYNTRSFKFTIYICKYIFKIIFGNIDKEFFLLIIYMHILHYTINKDINNKSVNIFFYV